MSECYISLTQRKARKRHICHLCHEKIPRGAEYICETHANGNGFRTLKRHIHCDALLDEFFKSDYICPEHYDDAISDWIRGRCLELCGYVERCDCIGDPFSCENMIRTISNINSRQAAMNSIRDARQGR